MERIVDRNNCCGCAACYAICGHNAIGMEESKGFFYPQIDPQKCVDCGLCMNVCPIVYRDAANIIVENQLFYACHNNDEKEWKASSSGGVFRILADYVIQQGGYVAGAIYDKNMEVRHFVTNREKDLEKFRGSKYVQSDTKTIYKEVKDILKNGKKVLFTGTPCQVEALKCYLKKPFENLLTCDIICTSVPSPVVFRDYIHFLEKKHGKKVTGINMKDKTKGWPYAKTRIYFEKGSSCFDTLDADLWIKAWSTELMNRPSCEHCRFTNYNRPGDLTIGDCWPVYHKKNAFSSPNGISQLMINTERGKLAFEAVKDKMTLMAITKEFAWQSKLEYPIVNNPLAADFWDDYRIMNFQQIAQKYWDYSLIKYYMKKYTPIYRKVQSLILHKILKK